MHDFAIPIQTVLDMTGNLCSSCQAKVREYIVANQFDQSHSTVDERLRNIMQKVSAETGISIVELRAKDNHRRLVDARRRVAIIARQQCISFPKIGAALQKHHTTVMNLVKDA